MSKIRSYMSLGELLRIAPTQTVGGSGSGQSGVTYLLRDDFSSDKAAGSVNGTPAEPGPGTRVVTDTNNKLSIAGGVLSFATGGVAAGDPGLWFGSLPMVLGRTVLGVLNDTLDGLEIGWDSNQSGVPLNTIRFNNDDVTLQIRQNGTGVAVGSFSLSTPYRCSIVLRNSNGSFYFIKGGLFSNWTLIWASSLGAGLNFPVATVVAATSVGTVDNLRVPTRLFIPFPLASDSFNRANGVLGLTDGAGHAEANGGGGLEWTGATFSISANKAINTPSTGSELHTDPGLEGNYTAGLNDSLTKSGTPVVSQSADTHGGSKSQQFTGIALNNNISRIMATPVANEWYIARIWGKRTAGSSGTAHIILNQTSGLRQKNSDIVDAGYTERVLVIRTNSTNTVVFYHAYESGTVGFDTVIVDDASAKKLTLSSLIASVVVATADVLTEVALTRAPQATEFGLCLNLDSASDPQNFVLVNLVQSGVATIQVVIEKCVAGVYTTLQSTTITYSAGAVLRAIKDGTKYRVFYNNLAVGTEQTISDAGIINNTRHGLFSTYEGDLLEDFTVWARGSANEYSGLDTL